MTETTPSRCRADRLCNAQRYERSEARWDTRAGHYERKLQTKAGEVRLKVPKLRAQTFETAIIERYRRRESSVEGALGGVGAPGRGHHGGGCRHLWAAVNRYAFLCDGEHGKSGSWNGSASTSNLPSRRVESPRQAALFAARE
jgi:hypothetical protein